jgi:hypothetical protein
MPATRILTIAAAAGLVVTTLPACDHAEETSLSLASAPLHLIIIEDDGSGLDGFANIEGLDPSTEVWSQAAVEMVIEDETEFDDGLVEEEGFEHRTRRFLLALAGTAGAAELAAAATAPTTAAVRDAAPARRETAAVSRTSSRDDSAELAAVAAPSRSTGLAPATRMASLSSMARPGVRPVKALEAHEIRQTIVRQLPKVRACYERTLKAEPSLRGRLVLSMSVKPTGDVSGAHISDDGIGSNTLTECVENAVASWSFPRGTETVAVDYPVTLKPSNGGW